MNRKLIVGFFSVLLVAAVTQNASAALVAYYPFDGNANDASGKGHDLTVSGATLTTGRFGNANSAYAFDGGTNVISGSFALPADATFSVWARNDNFSKSGNMLFNTGGVGQGPDLHFYNGKISWNTWDSDANPFAVIPSTSVDGMYHNYTVVADSSTSIASLYFDGALLGTAAYAAPGNIFTLGGAGGWDTFSYYGWKGTIDDVSIFNTAFTSQQVADLYNASVVPVPAAIWLFGSALAGLGFLGKRRFKR